MGRSDSKCIRTKKKKKTSEKVCPVLYLWTSSLPSYLFQNFIQRCVIALLSKAKISERAVQFSEKSENRSVGSVSVEGKCSKADVSDMNNHTNRIWTPYHFINPQFEEKKSSRWTYGRVYWDEKFFRLESCKNIGTSNGCYESSFDERGLRVWII